MYEDLVGKKEEQRLEVIDNGEKNAFASNPNDHITFFNNEKIVGKLQWYGNSLKFEGNAEESARLFFDHLAKYVFDIGNGLALEKAREEIEDLKKELDRKYDIEIENCFIDNNLGTMNLDHVNKIFSITKAVILPRTFEFYNPAEEDDLVAITRNKLEALMDRVEDIENIENELIYYKHICENLQKQLTRIEMEKLNSDLPRQRIATGLGRRGGRTKDFNPPENEMHQPPNLTYWDQWTSAWNDSVPRELEIELPLQELQLFDGDITWLMVICEDWEPDFKYTSWTGIERDLQQVDFKSMYETDPIPDNKWQAKFFGEPIKDMDEYFREGYKLCFQ